MLKKTSREAIIYETGIRLKQLLMLLKMGESISKSEAENAILRSQSVLDLRNDDCKQWQRLKDFFEDIPLHCYVAGRELQDHRDCPTNLFERLKTLIDGFVRSLQSKDYKSIELVWFRLGLEIADGTGTVNYPFEVVIGAGPDSEHALHVIQPEEREWSWSKPDLIDDLLTSLSLSLEEVFPRNLIRDLPEDSIFSDLDFDEFWGWFVIEQTLRGEVPQRRVPHWDENTLTLSWSDQVLYQFYPQAKNQLVLLGALNKNQWKTETEINNSGLTTQQINEAIRHFNKRFRGKDIGIILTSKNKKVSWEYIESSTNCG